MDEPTEHPIQLTSDGLKFHDTNFIFSFIFNFYNFANLGKKFITASLKYICIPLILHKPPAKTMLEQIIYKF